VCVCVRIDLNGSIIATAGRYETTNQERHRPRTRFIPAGPPARKRFRLHRKQNCGRC